MYLLVFVSFFLILCFSDNSDNFTPATVPLQELTEKSRSTFYGVIGLFLITNLLILLSQPKPSRNFFLTIILILPPFFMLSYNIFSALPTVILLHEHQKFAQPFTGDYLTKGKHADYGKNYTHYEIVVGPDDKQQFKINAPYSIYIQEWRNQHVHVIGTRSSYGTLIQDWNLTQSPAPEKH